MKYIKFCLIIITFISLYLSSSSVMAAVQPETNTKKSSRLATGFKITGAAASTVAAVFGGFCLYAVLEAPLYAPNRLESFKQYWKSDGYPMMFGLATTQFISTTILALMLGFSAYRGRRS